MMTATGERWALLIGIDRYSDEANDRRNLLGAVADVECTAAFLQSGLGMSSDHIITLKAANKSNKQPENLRTRPTKANVVAALKDIVARSKPGDFVYIHYSGHGDRVPTVYSDLKQGPMHDEVLCTLEEDIRDVEFGGLLDELTAKGLVVCVVLDCCYAGGTSRLDARARIRCRSVAEGSADAPGEDNPSSARRDLRNAIPVETWFYRPRGYNLFAACQPHEVAQEWTADDGQILGAMTYHLLQTLGSLRFSTEPVTYGLVQDVLEAKCKAKFKQQPMHLGDRSRVLFGGSRAPVLGSARLVASVVETNGKTATLNKGSANTLRVGDQFSMYHPSQACMGFLHADAHATAEAVVISVSELRCQVTPVDDGTGVSPCAGIGWLARLSSRAKVAIVNLLLPESTKQSAAYAEALRHLQQECSSLADATTPVVVRLNDPDRDADLTAELDENEAFLFRDRAGNPMPHVPVVRLVGSLNVRRMALLLQHLCAYQHVAAAKDLMTPGGSDDAPRYEMKLEEDEVEEGDVESLAAWRITFRNLGKRALYVTMLNLGPAYGVHQIFPDDGASSASVASGEEMPPLVLDMKVPPLLRAASVEPGFRMRDVIKAFVTTEQANFAHYRMPDLRGLDDADEAEAEAAVLQPRMRNGRLLLSPVPRSCFIEEKEIITAGRAL